jgi:hypothetical protein
MLNEVIRVEPWSHRIGVLRRGRDIGVLSLFSSLSLSPPLPRLLSLSPIFLKMNQEDGNLYSRKKGERPCQKSTLAL